jgi:Helix-turn-helix domain
MDKKIATSPEKKAAFEAIRNEFKGNGSATQRTRLQEAFAQGWPVSTFEAMRYLDIYFPPARIKELRDLGEPIQTLWVNTATESGDNHRIGLYVRQSGVQDAVPA